MKEIINEIEDHFQNRGNRGQAVIPDVTSDYRVSFEVD